MMKKLAKMVLILLLLVAGTAITVVDHLMIGVIIFFVMIAMVATGPKPAEDTVKTTRPKRNSDSSPRV